MNIANAEALTRKHGQIKNAKCLTSTAEMQVCEEIPTPELIPFVSQAGESYLLAHTITGLKACVVSVSGGVDSAVTLALCKHAQAMPNSPLQKVCLAYVQSIP
jgi:hypothetical protein